MTTEAEQKPWYKHPHVWLLITFPVLAILGGIDMLYLAATSTDSLVSDNYYKEGNNINQRIALEKTAVTKGITGQMYLGEDQKSVRILLNKENLGPLKLKLVHSTLSGLDQEVTLNNEGSMYSGKLKQGLQQGNWYMELHDANKTWSIRKAWSTQHQDNLVFP